MAAAIIRNSRILLFFMAMPQRFLPVLIVRRLTPALLTPVLTSVDRPRAGRTPGHALFVDGTTNMPRCPAATGKQSRVASAYRHSAEPAHRYARCRRAYRKAVAHAAWAWPQYA